MGKAAMIAGIGCRAGVSGEQVAAAIDAAIAALTVAAHPAMPMTEGLAADKATRGAAQLPLHLTAIATAASKATERGIREAANARGVPVLAIGQLELEAADVATATRSTHSMAAFNVNSVAEAAALAGASAIAADAATRDSAAAVAGVPTAANAADLAPDRAARLLLARITVGPVTCALADTTSP